MSRVSGVLPLVTVTAVGIVGGVLTDLAIRARSPRARVPAAATILVATAAVYPLARLGKPGPAGTSRREWTAIAATVVTLIAARRLPVTVARPLTAAAWAAHAAFDHLHERGDTSILPSWYPALCAGYDLGLAAMLTRSAQDG